MRRCSLLRAVALALASPVLLTTKATSRRSGHDHEPQWAALGRRSATGHQTAAGSQLATIGTQAIGPGHEPQHITTFRLHTVNATSGFVSTALSVVAADAD
jgi:hypothetical protein